MRRTKRDRGRRIGETAREIPLDPGCASWREGASGERPAQIRNDAGDIAQSLAGVSAEARRRLQESERVRVRWSGEHCARRTLFDDASGVHDCDAIGELRDHAEIVGDEDHSGAAVAAALAQQFENLRLHGDVERGRRLVGDDEPGS
jgi:hypothetical protein